jgi:hypothetical protein
VAIIHRSSHRRDAATLNEAKISKFIQNLNLSLGTGRRGRKFTVKKEGEKKEKRKSSTLSSFFATMMRTTSTYSVLYISNY